MRISTHQFYQQGLSGILERQAELARTQRQLSTGKKLLAPSDDPAAAAQVLKAREGLAQLDQYQRNIGFARTRLEEEDGALGAVQETLQRVRELAVQAGNGVLDDGQREAIALEVEHHLQGLLALANTKDSQGEYLFAGHRTATLPFVETPSGIAYQGDQGQRRLEVAPDLEVPVGDPGSKVFMAIPNGNGTFATEADPGNAGTGLIGPGSVLDPAAVTGHSYTLSFADNAAGERVYLVHDDTLGTYVVPPSGDPNAAPLYTEGEAIAFDGIQVTITGDPAPGDRFSIAPSAPQDAFTTLSGLAQALKDTSGTALHNALGRSLTDLDQAIAHVSSVRAEVGGRLNLLESREEANAAASLHLQKLVSGIEDLDYAEAITRLNEGLLALQAAQESFVKIQGLSLFNFIP